MPSQMPSSFASAAAAGQGSGRDSRSGRGDGRGTEWARRENRSTNGTVTFRRSSNAPHAQPSQVESLPTPSAEISEDVSQTPISSFEQSAPADFRYSKTRLLDMYKSHREAKESGAHNGDVSRLFADNWNPGQSNGTNGRAWGKTTDGRETYGPDACWDMSGGQRPVSLEDMSEDEKILFSSDVNSPMKPPPQNQNKDASGQGSNNNGRKTSVSHGSGTSAFGLSSPASSRPGTRRRETSDSVPFSAGLGSPAGTGRFPRDESSPFFSRKLTINDLKDETDDRPDEGKTTLPFGGLMRSNTGTNMGSAPLSPWGPAPQSATMSPMGTFGAFAMPNPTTPSEKRPGLFGMRATESRLAHLMPKDNNSEDAQSKPAERSWRTRPRTDTDPFGSDDMPLSSSGLGGGQDTSPSLNPQRKAPGLDTPIRGLSSDFGMSDVPGFRDAQLRAQSHHTPQGQNYNEPLSPDTNPYRSPPEDRRARDEPEDNNFGDDTHQHGRSQGLGGIPEHAPNAFGNIARNFGGGAFDGSDRSQTSSAAGTRGFSGLGGMPSLSNIGTMGGWPTNTNMVSTPDREIRSAFPGAFGNSIFGPMGDLPSPAIGGGMFGAPTPISRGGSKLGSLFPPAMQAQMQGVENDGPSDIGDMRQNNSFGAIGRGPFGMRDIDRHDVFSPDTRAQGPFSSTDTPTGIPTTSGQSNYQPSHSSSDSAPPTAQQRMMVMPDRMRWVYLDSQGQAQGPWSGLEMHDWYKASFFTADLSVKKVEDAEFEPLGQLIRRIGNSREPFLVPQIGIPHGPQGTQAGPPFTSAATAPAVQPGAVQPPFAGAFPSFGTTLTAEQQNNLERRKQEEQYLMARQREFLAQQQVNMKQMQMGGLPSGLHHHSSAHSLQSQPSFGSMTSPITLPPQPPMPGGISGFFDAQPRQAPNQMIGGIPAEFLLPDDLARLGIQDRPQPVGPPTSQAQQINALFGQPQQSEAQRQAARAEHVRQNDPEGFKARLREFEQLRAEHDQEEVAQASSTVTNEPIGPPAQTQQEQPEQSQYQEAAVPVEEKPVEKSPEPLSLTQQVQKAASAAASSKPSPISAPQPESPWAKVNTSLPMPFPPPPQSTTPLPAPTAQRGGRSGLPDTLHAEVSSRSETPEAASAGPTLAPWAVQPVEAPKGPSLKEIQEAEAKKAAKAEEIAAAARRVQLEQEMKLLASQPAAPAPGLPTTSTWGSVASPAPPSNPASAWAKPVAAKTPTVGNAKKTLADIQREEESRKKKLAAATAVAQPSSVPSGGKRYADLAGKVNTSLPASGGSWSTVGAGGKVKIPTGPASASVSTPMRSVSSASVASPAARTPARPAPAVRSVVSSQAGITAANDEFKKWAKAALGAKDGLDSNINVDEFILMLSSFPPEVSIIADSVYSNSKVMDGRRFAEEYIRRHKQAEKGIVEPANTTSNDKSGGGWSEVAKKGPPKEEPTAGFKVVPNKKKGKK